MSGIFSNVAPLRVDFDKELLLQKMTRDLYGYSDFELTALERNYKNSPLQIEALRIERIRRKSVGMK